MSTGIAGIRRPHLAPPAGQSQPGKWEDGEVISDLTFQIRT
jgi:hypothetical protein